MIPSETLRKLAEEIRAEQSRREEMKRAKCAQILSAAAGLALLQRKLGGRHVG